MRACRLIVCVFFLGTLATPRAAHAGLVDIIWEMSGPQMLGAGVECEWELTATNAEWCYVNAMNVAGNGQRRPDRWFGSFTQGLRLYFSTGKNAEAGGQEFDFRAFRTWMLELDPMLHAGREFANGVRVYTGAGASLNRFFVVDARDFNNYAFKLRPLAVEYRRGRRAIGAGYTLRLYPNGFDANGIPPQMATLSRGTQTERVHGLEIILKFGG